jgi:ABC-2 type transport system ATP-binding protein
VSAVVLRAIGGTASYRRFGGEPQLRDVTVDLPPGVTALIGRNGAGKSTFMKVALGLMRLRSGTIEVLGFNPSVRRERAALHRNVGYLPQDFGSVPSFTVAEYVEYAAWLKQVPKAVRHRGILTALEHVELTDNRSKKMGHLSGGMRRRAGIAAAIVHNPSLLVLDEPTTGLDPEQRVRFRELIRDIAQERSVLLSSHLVEDVRALADLVVVLDGGRLGFAGSVAALEARAVPGVAGDSDLERGYISVIAAMGNA